MTIPIQKLASWARPVTSVAAADTHFSIRSAIAKYAWPKGFKPEIYLQGSYKNSTNIRGDSDVDIVVQMGDPFKRGKTLLTSQPLYRPPSFPPYPWSTFKADVLNALVGHYNPKNVQEGNKSLKVAPGSNRLPADLVVCEKWRVRKSDSSLLGGDYIEGMRFYVPSEGRWVTNYPKLHYERGTQKHKQTKNLYKPVVRMFKNARTYLVNNNEIADTVAPSYFLECLIFNIPDYKFDRNLQKTFCGVLEWLTLDTLKYMMCQHGQQLLCGDTPEQWSMGNAWDFLQQLEYLWDGWSE